MKHFAIISNGKKDEGLSVAKSILEKLEGAGAGGQVLDLCRETLEVSPEAEAIIVIGGDGSMLSAVKRTRAKLPLIGINRGNVGYLTEVEESEIDTLIRRLIADDVHIEERMMLKGRTLTDGEEPGESAVALNDVVLSRRGDLQVVGYRIFVNGLFLTDYYADGVILSTPTGSTGYNLSAGGPIVEPSASLILLTPVCPHTLNSRSIILSAEDTVTVRLLPPKHENAQAGADFDGDTRKILCSGDGIEVSKADVVTRMIKLGQDGFLQILHKKIAN